MSFKIVTDSCVNLPDDLIEKYNLSIISLVFLIDGKEYFSYEKGKTSNLQRFYAMMRDGKVITTSLVSAEDTIKVIEPLFAEGHDVLYLGFSSGLSGSFQSACLSIRALGEKYPERKHIEVDTLSASLGQGLLVHYAHKLREQGKSIEEVSAWVEENKLKLCHWFTVDDLSYLKRGGRVSSSAAFIGTMLKIKPVLHVDNKGYLIPISKERGRKSSIKELVRKMEDLVIDTKQVIYISHGDCIEDAEYLRDRIKDKIGCTEFLINFIDPVIGAHSGPGTLALFFLGKER